MSYLLKDLYSPSFYDRFSGILQQILPDFDKKRFIADIFDEAWPARELKERMRHTSQVMHQFMPDDFEKAAVLLENTIECLIREGFRGSSIEFMFFPDYIELYGIGHFEASVKSVEFTTRFISCEFAVRPFILRYGDRMIQQMLCWSQHPDHKVRRLASEGMRPRLPWAMAVPALKKNPAPILPLLENLKNDPSDWVRRSVANNLNDISKTHPDIVLSIAHAWQGISRETDAIIKHACRSLLKQGHPEILAYYGLQSEHLVVSDACIQNRQLKTGDDLHFSFAVRSSAQIPQTIRMEYGIYYLRQSGQHSRKVFKISERQIEPGEVLHIARKQSFRIITTRKFYPGPQYLSVIVNGQEQAKLDFEIVE